MAMRLPWNMRKRHWLSIPSAINQTKSTSKMSLRPSDLRLPIVPHKAGFGNWTTPCGNWLNAFLIMLPGSDEKRQPFFNYYCSKNRRQPKRNSVPSTELFRCYLSASLPGYVNYPWRGFYRAKGQILGRTCHRTDEA